MISDHAHIKKIQSRLSKLNAIVIGIVAASSPISSHRGGTGRVRLLASPKRSSAHGLAGRNYKGDETMIRALAISTLAAASLAMPAVADDTVTSGSPAVTAHAAELSNFATQNQVHRMLASQGYVQITEFGRDDDGRWTAAALKDGKKVFVAVALPAKAESTPTN
jgi:hypothetical protein